MKLYRLIYTSDKFEYLGLADLREILAESEKNNAKLGITGLLLVLDKKFFQVLEGPSTEMNTLYEKIMRDLRHKNPNLLSYTQIHDRQFKEWSARGVNLASMNPQMASLLIKKYGESESGIAIPEDPWLAFSLLYDIYSSIHLSEWADTTALPDPVAAPPEKVLINYQKYRVLVVEDDTVVRRIILKMLQQIGFRYIGEADNGASALQEVDKIPPDLILCDIEMKPMDGLSFLQVLRKNQGDLCPKFIFLTGHTEATIINCAYELGVDAFIIKPVRATQLRYQINQVVSQLDAG